MLGICNQLSLGLFTLIQIVGKFNVYEEEHTPLQNPQYNRISCPTKPHGPNIHVYIPHDTLRSQLHNSQIYINFLYSTLQF